MNTEKLKTAYQYLLPQHGLSRLVGRLADCQKSWVKGPFMRWFKNKYQVDLSEAEREQLEDYKNFNDFFTRALKPDARPLADAWDFISPVDGEVSQLGSIDGDRVFQAKGQTYSLNQLLGDKSLAQSYQGGDFATLYLSPKDYHRIHAPLAAELRAMTYIPGQLFSVNHITARTIPGLFARNERLTVHLNTEHGPLAMVFVGATIVASIETVWSGIVTPPQGPAVRTWRYQSDQINFESGQEMARFRLGSTVILCAPKGMLEWSKDLASGSIVRMGQGLAQKQS